jgi:hypothetical protein
MDCPIRVSDDYLWIEGRYVNEGEQVAPGDPIMRVTGPTGVSEEVRASCWGFVGFIEGNRAPSADKIYDASALDACASGGSDLIRYNNGLGHVYRTGDIICQIISRPEGCGGQTTGLRPRRAAHLAAIRDGFAHK